jgi:hypothetical protein
MSKPGLAEYFLSTEHGKGGDLMNPKVQHFQARKLVIRCDPPQPVVADGQVLGKGTVKIKILKHALRVITGQQLGLASEKPGKEPKQKDQANHASQAGKATQSNKDQEDITALSIETKQ